MLALTNGKILTMAGQIFEKGTVVVDQQKISALSGSPVPPDGARVIDVSGKYVLPGFIDAHTHLGIYEEIYTEGDDTNEISDPVTPHLRAIDAVNMEDLAFTDALQGGVTTVMTGPGSANVIGGLSAVLKTSAKTVKAVIKIAGLKAAFGENKTGLWNSKDAHHRATAAPRTWSLPKICR